MKQWSKLTDKHARHLFRLLLGIASLPVVLLAQTPQWWSTRGVTSNQAAADYAAANQGQAKQIASQAVAELNSRLPQGAGPVLNQLAATLSGTTPGTSDYSPINVGQLKALAQPFYDRLIEVGYATQYPWVGSIKPADDYVAANLGQLKALFCFDLSSTDAARDVNANRLPDWWEKCFFSGLINDPNGPSPRGDGRTILQSYQQSVSPVDFWNGALPSLQVTSGNSQCGSPGSWLPQPLVVKVTDANGNPLGNVPVLFCSGTAPGRLAPSSGTNFSGSHLLVRSGSDGLAMTYYQLPNAFASTSTISAVVSTGTQRVQTTFSASTSLIPTDGMRLWLRADAGVTAAGGAISAWADQSPNGFIASRYNSNYSPLLAANGLNGRPVVRFVSSEAFSLPNIMGGASSGEMFVVLKALDRGIKLIDLGTATGGNGYPASDYNIYENFGTTTQYNLGRPTRDLGSFHIYNVSAQAGQFVARINGFELFRSATNSVSFATSGMIGRSLSAGGYFRGDIAEIFVFSRVLSTEERAALESYLGMRHGLGAPAQTVLDLSAKAFSPTQVSLTWSGSNSTFASNYQIQRKTGNGDYVPIARVNNMGSWADSSAAPNTQYTYRIQAATCAGASGHSNEVSVVTPGEGTTVPMDALALWLKADSGVNAPNDPAVDLRVSSWMDGSGNAHYASQATESWKPWLVSGSSGLNGRPILQFNYNSLSIPNLIVTGTQQFTWVYVARVSDANGTECFASQGINSSTAGYCAGTFTSYGQCSALWGGSNAAVRGIATCNGQTLIGVSTYDGADHRMWINGLFQGACAKSDSNFNQGGKTYIGRDYTGNAIAKADLAEIMVFNRSLSADEIFQLGVYLDGKYRSVSLPTTPNTLTAQAVSADRVNLGWQYPLGSTATRFRIERSTAGGNFETIATLDQTTGYQDCSVTAGVSYSYRITAINSAGASATSAAATTTTPAANSQSVPWGALSLWLKADAGVISDTSGKVYAWLDQSGNRNDATQSSAGYMPTVISGTGGINGKSALRFDYDSLSIPNLIVTGTQQFTWVYAARVNDANGTECFACQGISSSTAGYCAGTFTSYGQCSALWGGSNAAVRGIATCNGQTLIGVSTYDGTDHRMWINGLFQGASAKSDSNFNQGGKTYIARDYAANAYAKADLAEIMVFNRSLSADEIFQLGVYLDGKYRSVSLPTTPNTLTAQAVSADRVNLGWQYPLGSTATRFRIERSTAGGNFETIATLEQTTGYLDCSVTAGVSYSYRITAINSAGASETSAAATTTTPAANSQSVPWGALSLWLKADTGVISDTAGKVYAWLDQSGNRNDATQSSAGSMPTVISGTGGINGKSALRFEYDSLSIPNLIVTGTQKFTWVYVARWHSLMSGQCVISQGVNTSTAGYFAGLLPGTEGQYNNTWGGYSGQVRGIPSLLNRTIAGISTYDGISHRMWINGVYQGRAGKSDSNFNQGGKTFIGTDITSRSAQADIAEIMVFNRPLSSEELCQLGVYLNSQYSIAQTPLVPSDVLAQSVSSTQVNLTWRYPLGITQTRFLIERSTDGGPFESLATVEQTQSYLDTNLEPSTSYVYRVTALNAAGTSAASNQSSVCTGDAPAVPLDSMALWLKADAGVVTGTDGRVFMWLDQSGNNNDLFQLDPRYGPQLISGTNNLNGRPALRFYYSTLSIPKLIISGTNPFTWVFVAKYNPTTYPQCLMAQGVDSTTAGYFAGVFSGTAVGNSWGSSNGFIGSSVSSANKVRIRISSYDGNKHCQWIDGLYCGSAAKSDSNFNQGGGTYIGNNMLGAALTEAEADLSEVIVFNRTLTAAEVRSLTDYLNRKYLPDLMDADGDGLTNAEEQLLQTNPRNSDTNANGLWDGMEDLSGLDPRATNDPFANQYESSLGSPFDPGLWQLPATLPGDQTPPSILLSQPGNAVLLP